MHSCNNCGAAQAPDATICTECGALLEETRIGAPESAEVLAAPIGDAGAVEPISLEKNEIADPAPLAKPEPVAENPAENTPPKKPFPTKLVIGFVTVLAALAILLALFMPKKEFEHASVVFQALGDTFAACSAEFEQASLEIGLAPIFDAFEQKGITTAFDVTIPVDASASVSLHLLQAFNAAVDQIYLKADIAVMGLSLSILEASFEKQFLAVSSPFLFSGVYGVSLNELDEDLSDSELGAALDVDEESVEALLEYVESATRLYAAESLSSKTENAVNEALVKLENATVTTGPEESTALVNDNEVLCARYVSEIPKGALEEFLQSCMDAYFNDEMVSDYFQAVYGLQQGYFDGMTTQDMLAEMEANIHEVFSDVKNITLTVYLKDGMALRSELLFVERDNQETLCVLELGRNGNLTDAAAFGVFYDENYMRLTHQGNIIPKNGVVESTLTFYAYSGDTSAEPVGVDYFFQWDTKQAADNFHMFASIPDHPSIAEMNGSVRLDNGVIIDPLVLYFNDGYTDYTIPISVHYTPTHTVKTLTAEAKDILSLNEEELQALQMEIESSLNRWFGYGF